MAIGTSANFKYGHELNAGKMRLTVKVVQNAGGGGGDNGGGGGGGGVWLLASGAWDDSGVWDDSAQWKDAA